MSQSRTSFPLTHLTKSSLYWQPAIFGRDVCLLLPITSMVNAHLSLNAKQCTKFLVFPLPSIPVPNSHWSREEDQQGHSHIRCESTWGLTPSFSPTLKSLTAPMVLRWLQLWNSCPLTVIYNAAANMTPQEHTLMRTNKSTMTKILHRPCQLMGLKTK